MIDGKSYDSYLSMMPRHQKGYDKPTEPLMNNLLSEDKV